MIRKIVKLEGMRQTRDYRLNEQDLQLMEEAIRHDKRPGVRERSMVIRLLHLGYAPTEIAQMQALHPATVYDYWKRWQQAGLDGLVTQPRSGRPCKSNPAYCQALEQVLEQDPQALGYDFAIWTVDRLRGHLEQTTGVALSESRFRHLLKRLGYRYRRPKFYLGQRQDATAKAQAADLLEALKKKPLRRMSHWSLWTKSP